MPFVNVHIHLVWSTKNREPYLDTPEKRKLVWTHIKKNALLKGFVLDVVNGYDDHCHCLLRLDSNQTIAKIVQLIKGESSYWINVNNIAGRKFDWQDEYFAIAVSASAVDKVRDYIMRQERHHRERNYQQEFDKMMDACKPYVSE